MTLIPKNKTRSERHKIPVLLLMLAVYVLPLLMTVANAQSPNLPAVSDGTQEVNKEGYTLKPAGTWVNEWPNVKFNFSVERGDQSQFQSLTYADIQARHDNQPLNIQPNDLAISGANPAKVLLLLDASKSMTKPILGVSKLAGAKSALEAFINSLGATDAAAIYTFDISAYEIVRLSNAKDELLAGVAAYNIRRGGGTAIYDSIKNALAKAQQQGIKNIVLLSDGCEWTEKTKWLSEAELAAYKRDREKEIAALSRSAGVRIFTIAIGDKDLDNPAYRDRNGYNVLYVDEASLTQISQSANGGNCYFIDLPKLDKDSAGDGRKYYNLLVGELKNVLEQIRQSFHYDYSLTLRLSENLAPDSAKHKVSIVCNIGNVQLPVEISYRWAGGQAVIDRTEILEPVIFIKPPAKTEAGVNLSKIYLILLAVLIGLALVPSVGRAFSSNQGERQLKKSVIKVTGDSQLVGELCPIEGRVKIKAGDVAFICPSCKTPHHLGCWQLNRNHCGIRRCGHEAVIPQTVAEKVNTNKGR